MSEGWGSSWPSEGHPPPPPVAVPPPRRPRFGPRSTANRVATVAGLVGAAGVVVAMFWVLSGTFSEESRPDDGRTPRSLPIVALPVVPDGVGSAGDPLSDAVSATCAAEAKAIETARQAAALMGIDDDLVSVRDFMADPEGEFFAVAQDGTVTTLQPLPPGCTTP